MEGWHLVKVGYSGWTTVADSSRAASYPTFGRRQTFIRSDYDFWMKFSTIDHPPCAAPLVGQTRHVTFCARCSYYQFLLDGEGNKSSGEFGMEKTNESPENRSLPKISLDFTVSKQVNSFWPKICTKSVKNQISSTFLNITLHIKLSIYSNPRKFYSE